MRFLVLTADYSAFIHWFYTQHRGLGKRPYAEQMRMRIENLFGGPFFYSDNLKKLGHEANDIYVNNEHMQKTWAREHGFRWSEDWRWGFRLRRGLVPWISRIKDQRWCYDILAAQIRYYKPDVLLNQAMDTISSRFLQEIKPHVGLLMGEHASPLPQGEDYSCYDSSDECVELIQYYLDHKNEREAIARAGQERTMREHTYYQRVEELVDIVGRYL